MKILVLAAGYGTRLYPLIKDTPKPLLEIAGKPIINYITDKVRDIPDLNEVIVVSNAKFYDQFLHWAEENKDFPQPITIINDGTTTPDDRLGSVGDICYVLQNHPFADDLLVVGGDNIFDYSLEEYIQFAKEKSPHVTIGTYDIGKKENATEFGVVEADEGGKIVSFEEKPTEPKSSLIAMCFYFFPKESLSLLNDYIQESGKTDKAGYYIHWLSENSTVFAYVFEGKWYDIGSIEAYQEAQELFKKK